MKQKIEDYSMRMHTNTLMMRDEVSDIQQVINERLKPEIGQTALYITYDIESKLLELLRRMWDMTAEADSLLYDLDDI